ncbi:MAG: NUDIX hydrolase, partial [Chloroflexota bacterium]
MIKEWKKLTSETAADFYIFQARRNTSESPCTGKVHEVVVLESPDWVNVVAVTPDRQVVLIRQFRHGREEFTLEIPGG